MIFDIFRKKNNDKKQKTSKVQEVQNIKPAKEVKSAKDAKPVNYVNNVLADPAPEIKSADNKEKIIEYLNKKYGENFTYIENVFGQTAGGYINIYASSDRFPDEKILAGMFDNGKYDIFGDNYTAFLFREQLVEKLEKCCSEAFGKSKVIYSVINKLMPNDVRHNDTLESYSSRRDVGISFSVVTGLPARTDSRACFEEQLKNLSSVLIKNKIHAFVNVYFTDNAAKIDEITAENCYEHFRKKDWFRECGCFITDSEKILTAVEWR